MTDNGDDVILCGEVGGVKMECGGDSDDDDDDVMCGCDSMRFGDSHNGDDAGGCDVV